MSDIEKVICCERGDNDNALATLIAATAGRNDNNGLLATLATRNNDQWNNPFVYLVWMMMANRMGWGGGYGCGDGGGCYNGQMSAFQTQMQDNHNSDLLMGAIKGAEGATRELATLLNCDFNTLNSAICDVRAGIQQLSGQVGFSAERVINAVTLGNCNIIQALKDCCCEAQKEILAQSNMLQRGQDFINRSIERGFADTAFQAQQDKCELIQAGNANTQRIVDLLNGHWKDELAQQVQDLKFQLSQERQNRLLISRLGGNCGNGCGDGCGNGWGF